MPRDGRFHSRNLEAELAGLKYLFKLIEINDRFILGQTYDLINLTRLSEEELLRRVNEFPCPGTGSIEQALSNPSSSSTRRLGGAGGATSVSDEYVTIH